mmetsp:Transcript_67369/g.152440  ORF Transcript_67369/g.152440 Transcript_67369/m.152440 type:complete len:249 (+) Transcript_67369:1157-1903(+)
MARYRMAMCWCRSLRLGTWPALSKVASSSSASFIRAWSCSPTLRLNRSAPKRAPAQAPTGCARGTRHGSTSPEGPPIAMATNSPTLKLASAPPPPPSSPVTTRLSCRLCCLKAAAEAAAEDALDALESLADTASVASFCSAAFSPPPPALSASSSSALASTSKDGSKAASVAVRASVRRRRAPSAYKMRARRCGGGLAQCRSRQRASVAKRFATKSSSFGCAPLAAGRSRARLARQARSCAMPSTGSR